MQICKPTSLGFSSRPIEYRKRFGLCLSHYLHVPFAQAAGGTLWGEQSLWNFVAQEMAQPMLDEGVAKLTPEFLVHGHAYPPVDQPSACAVRVRLGGVEKTLLAFGERTWQGDLPSAPQPVERVALTWANAYGGADFAANPQGRGRVAEDGVLRLPALELPGSRLLRPDQAVEPAGFGALDAMHPYRLPFRGTYDSSYLKEHSPGFAPDLDWRYFNMAPHDQWIDAPLRGDEPFALDHLHPMQPHIAGNLPGLRVRAFANYRLAAARGGGHKLREVPMRLSTVWFFPHADRMVLVFQGMAETGEDDGSDIDHLMGALERLGEPRSDAHYAEALDRRLDPVQGGLAGLDESDLLPEGIDTVDPAFERSAEAFAMDGLQGDAQYRRAQVDVSLAREQLVEEGKDPDAMGIVLAPREKASPSMSGLPAYLKEKQAQMAQQQLASLEDMVDQVKQALDFADANDIDLAQLVHRGPPVYRAHLHLDEMKLQLAGAQRPLDESVLAPALLQRERAERLGYLQGAHMQPPAHPMAPDDAARTRKEIEWMLARGLRHWPEIDLTGADLSGLDLRGTDFTGAWLERVNLQRANVSGALFSAAVLAHADLRNAIGLGANFTAANLGRSQLAGAVLDQANFTGATLSHCALMGTQFRKAIISGVQLIDTTWGAADWTGVRGSGVLFYKFDLRGVVLAEAELDSPIFVECDLSGVDMQAANLAGATFTTCTLDGARLAGAVLDRAIFAKGCSLAGVDLSRASLKSANLGETVMDNARLVQAVLDGAHLAQARLAGCDARLASARGALLRRTVLKNARLAGINLQDAVLQHADLRGSDLRNANLFGADLSRARLNGDVQFQGALLKRARTWPRLSPEQQAMADLLDPM